MNRQSSGTPSPPLFYAHPATGISLTAGGSADQTNKASSETHPMLGQMEGDLEAQRRDGVGVTLFTHPEAAHVKAEGSDGASGPEWVSQQLDEYRQLHKGKTASSTPPRERDGSAALETENKPPGSVPVIDGAHARVPNALLDRSKAGQPSNVGQPAPKDFNSTFQEGTMQDSTPSSHSLSRPISIDTGVIDLTGDDGDEPVFVSEKRAEKEIEVDEERTDGIVCCGAIETVMLLTYGFPDGLLQDGPAYDARCYGWARAQGYAPLTLTYHPPIDRSLPERQLPSGWTVGYPVGHKAEVAVSFCTPQSGHHAVQEDFAILSQAAAQAIGPLIGSGQVFVDARARKLPGRSSNFFHPVELLVFARRSSLPHISKVLEEATLTLQHPKSYDPFDYPRSPPYVNPHNPPVGGYSKDMDRARLISMGLGGNGMFLVPSKEMNDEQRRTQIEQVYGSLRGGEDLEDTDPGPLISTPLYSHQKQALTFLLSREADRSFEKAASAPTSEGGWSSSSQQRSRPAQNPKGKGKEEPSGDDGSGTISLWQSRRDSRGRIESYFNVVTQTETKSRPEVCRGAILADDMGLGKTITVIALIAKTLPEARDFGDSALPPLPPELATDESDDDVQPTDFSLGFVHSHPSSYSGDTSKGKKRKRGEQQRIAKKRRLEALERRCRATLIVCPLSIISNWEDQISEHWSAESPPSVYVYHGSSRITDPDQLANYDVVLTTYSTLGSEFSNQRTWNVDDDDSSKQSRKDLGDRDWCGGDSDIELVDAQGNVLSKGKGKAGKNGQKKKSAKREAKESPNTLQRVEWFRIVLDEAHVIKEASTLQSKAVCNLSAQRRLCLTGTPIQNRMDDLFALIKFLRLHPFTDRSVWNQYMGQPKPRGLEAASDALENADSMALVRVQTVMKFLTIRRTKGSIRPDGKPLLTLPARYGRIVYLSFDEREKARYTTLHSRYRADYLEMARNDTVSTNYATILQELLILRMACDHSGLVDDSKDAVRFRAGDTDLIRSIREDGLTKQKAAALFALFRDIEQAACVKCGRDLADTVEEASLALADDDVDVKPTKTNTRSRKAEKDRSETSTPQESDVAMPKLDGGESLRPVLTRCQHVFCSKCFKQSVCPQWPSPSGEARHECSVCKFVLSPLLDALQLEPSDFAATEAPDSRMPSGPSSPRTVKSDQSEGFSDTEETVKGQTEGEARVVKDEKALSGGDTQAPTLPSVAKLKPPRTDTKSPQPTHQHPRLSEHSTKTRALIDDLMPFSMCNPASANFTPDAPKLVHVAAEPSGDGQSRPKAKVLVRPLMGLEEGRYEPIKSVVFSQWTRMLDRIQALLCLHKIRFARLDGSMARPARAAALDSFKRDQGVEVLLVSLRAGGVGLNLTSASRAYLMDPFWNPAVENQAFDRVHRMGQMHPVVMTRFIIKNSIEEKMLEIQKRKIRIAGQGLGGVEGRDRKEARKEELSILFG